MWWDQRGVTVSALLVSLLFCLAMLWMGQSRYEERQRRQQLEREVIVLKQQLADQKMLEGRVKHAIWEACGE